jgi:hypothetical protein
MNKVVILCLIALVVTIGCGGTSTTTEGDKPTRDDNESAVIPETAYSPASRYALIIGNSEYEQSSVLENPKNDAQDMAEVARQTGFQLYGDEPLLDATYEQMERAIIEFTRLAPVNSEVLFYFAGHGFNLGGEDGNFLVPVDFYADDENQAKRNAIAVNDLLAYIERIQARTAIIILDARRDNPYARGFSRSLKRGLGEITNIAPGFYIAFAAAEGETASDGVGSNGLFTGIFKKYAIQPGMRIEDAMIFTTKELVQIAGQRQRPWSRSSLTEKFYFLPPETQGNTTLRPPETEDSTASMMPTPFPEGDRERPAIWLKPDLVDNADRTVTDRITGLMWQQYASPQQFTWEEAVEHCENITYAGYSDWRLPDIMELLSLTDDTRYYPAIDTDFFPDCQSSDYWSATTDAVITDYAWFVGFYFGYVNDGNKTANSYYVRCCRSF